MEGKTISKGTMGLKFMQNAQRAKLKQQTEIQQAKIDDEAKWEISPEVRASWGAASTSKLENVTHSSSYLPFIFSAEDSEDVSMNGDEGEPAPLFKGRRTFDGGQEVDPKVVEPPASEEPDPSTLSNAGSGKRPATISGFRAPPITARKDEKKPRTKTAQELIRDSSIRPVRMEIDGEVDVKPAVAATGFVKPAGVDAPAPSARVGKLKRERDPGAESMGTEGKKRRKKKKEA